MRRRSRPHHDPSEQGACSSSFRRRRARRAGGGGSGLVVALLISLATPALAVPEIELNDFFDTRQMLPFGTTSVEGDLRADPADDYPHFNGRLAFGTPGDVDSFTIMLDPLAPFTAMIDNGVDIFLSPDTVIGRFDALGNLIETDDDGSPLGDGRGSVIAGTADLNGNVFLRVTGFPDFNFDGSHSVVGDYKIVVLPSILLDQTLDNFGDVDFFQFTGLVPATSFTANISSASVNFDSTLGWFALSGANLATDDDGGAGRLSRITGTVPGSGALIFAVSHFPDTSLVHEHLNVGTYTLSLTATYVPEPATAILLGGGLLAFLAVSRRITRRG